MTTTEQNKPAVAQSRAEGANSNEGLAAHVARFMSYAYQRGKLDASGFPNCKEKELAIKKVGDLEAEKWIPSAKALLDMNGYGC